MSSSDEPPKYAADPASAATPAAAKETAQVDLRSSGDKAQMTVGEAHGFSLEEEKALLRRVDWRLVPMCALIFMVKSIDVNNAANARIMNQGTSQNILKQLKMTGDDFNFVSTVYFIPFLVFEIPSLLLIKRMLPSRFQARIMFTWGIALACHAAVTTKTGIYIARFFLGFLEAGMFPGVILQLAYWYRADEMTMRLLWFYAFEFFSNVISALLAFGFDYVSGKGGLSGWQWLFLIEGIITILFSVVVWFALPDFPEQAKWLTPRERAFLQARLPENAPRSAEAHFNKSEIVAALKDIRLWLFTLIFATKTVGSSGLNFYLPTIVADLKLTSIAKSQLLTIPASVVPLFMIALSSWLVNNRHVPSPLIALIYSIITLACYSVLYTYPNLGGVYAATIITGSISHAWFPIMWPWRLQTTSRATGSAFAIGFVNSLGQIGSLVGPQIFRSQYKPKYTVSFGVAMGFTGLCIIFTAVTWWFTRVTEKQTRDARKRRIAAAKNNEYLREDVDVDADFAEKPTTMKKTVQV